MLLNSSNHVLICVILYRDTGDRCIFHIGTCKTSTCFYLNCFRTIRNISSCINKNTYILKHLSMYECFPVCSAVPVENLMTTSAATRCHVEKLDTPFQSLDLPIILSIFLNTTWQLCAPWAPNMQGLIYDPTNET